MYYLPATRAAGESSGGPFGKESSSARPVKTRIRFSERIRCDSLTGFSSLGHANANVTLSIYLHALKADEVAAGALWENSMAGVISASRSTLKKTPGMADVSKCEHRADSRDGQLIETKLDILVPRAGLEPALPLPENGF